MTDTKKTIAEALGMTDANKDEPIWFKWYEDFGRMGSIEGLRQSTRAKLSALDGKRWYLGEVLGKHSDIDGTFDASSFEIFDITKFEGSGFDPFEARATSADGEEEAA